MYDIIDQAVILYAAVGVCIAIFLASLRVPVFYCTFNLNSVAKTDYPSLCRATSSAYEEGFDKK